jgi:hypothetical protein
MQSAYAGGNSGSLPLRESFGECIMKREHLHMQIAWQMEFDKEVFRQ